MGLFNKLSEPVFLKESSSAQEQLEKLKELEPSLNEEGQAKLQQNMKYIKYGIEGERNIIFELKNSHMPMYIIHDLYLRDGDLTSQIDFLVVTRKLCFVIECKNLYGDIEIDSQGAFVRTFDGQRKKEGIYSPITQNQRHMALLKKMRVEQSKGFLSRFFRDRYFEDDHRSIVVLANDKTVLNARYAKKEIKEQVIRADQLVGYIKESYQNSRAPELSDNDLQSWAQSYLDMGQKNHANYLKKYEPYKIKDKLGRGYQQKGQNQWQRQYGSQKSGSQSGTASIEQLIKDLRVYRWNTSQDEGIKPYLVFTDIQMKDLIDKFPANSRELKKVSGFGDIKVQKYGKEILAILDKYRGRHL